MNTFLELKTNNTEKHKKYNNYYGKSELYWGLGIENELYLQFNKNKIFTRNFFIKNHNRERYSVNYFDNYKKEIKNEAFNEIILENIEMPILINAHSFLHTDISNNSKKLYTKLCEHNPKFCGKTVSEEMIEFNQYFKDNINHTWLYDGDTIEFTTLNFYNSKLKNITKELVEIKHDFVKNIQEFQKEKKYFMENGKITLMEENYPFAVYLTNLNNISMFNNGTLHYNLTLPTRLNKNGLIKNREKFINDHKKAIKIIQWLEPLIISVYNSCDYFSTLSNYNNSKLFSNCSQRCVVSRYISVGTYDSDLMIPGKMLTIKTKLFENINNWWYDKYHENSAYNKLEEIGLDINFNKHYNHGIELRFLDHIKNNELIYESFEFLIYLMDYSLDIENILNPIKNNNWNKLVCNTMKYGKEYNLTKNELKLYSDLFNHQFEETNIHTLFYEIFKYLKIKYNDIVKKNDNYFLIPKGKFSKLTLQEKQISNEYLVKNEIIIDKKSFLVKFFNNLFSKFKKK
jgi:hypothetical protein